MYTKKRKNNKHCRQIGKKTFFFILTINITEIFSEYLTVGTPKLYKYMYVCYLIKR